MLTADVCRFQDDIHLNKNTQTIYIDQVRGFSRLTQLAGRGLAVSDLLTNPKHFSFLLWVSKSINYLKTKKKPDHWNSDVLSMIIKVSFPGYVLT